MQRHSVILSALAAWLTMGAAPVDAQSSDGQCGGVSGVAATHRVGVARVSKSHPRLNFVRDADDGHAECPAAGPRCRDRAYVIAGDVVLTLPEAHEGHLCASFADKMGRETYGWLPADALVPLPDAEAKEKDWVGTWRRTEADITITRTGNGGLAAEGSATWGAGDPRRVRTGAVHEGGFDGPARRSGDILLVTDESVASFEAAEDTCAVRLRRAGPYLVVEDNQRCGGMNVSFSGLYVRR